MSNLTDAELLDALGVEVGADIKSSKSPREERIIAGFEDIERFVEQHGRPPNHGETNDIFERIYAVRLDAIRNSEESRAILSGLDKHRLLNGDSVGARHIVANLDDEALLAELGVSDESDITKLTHVKPRAEIRAAEEIARRQSCEDFNTFKPLFIKVQEELNSKARRTVEFKDNAQVQQGDFFILGGQKVYVAQVGDEFINDYDRPDRRLRVIYDNGTESDILLRSLQRALQKDEGGRRITDAHAGPLFSDVVEDDDLESGIIYVLRSNLDHPFIKEHRDVIHKIGVTGGDIQRRIANAKMDPTFLMADVEVVATYKLSNINRTKLENLIHRFFEPAKLNVEIMDRFGNPIVPREWFLIPIAIIDEAVSKIRNGSILNYEYSQINGNIVLNKMNNQHMIPIILRAAKL